MAALLALWLVALTAAPLVASVLAGDGPKMACCKRQMKNCCCRKGAASKPSLVPIASCSQSCATARSVAAHGVIFSAPANAADPVLAVEKASIGFVSSMQGQETCFARHQRPPPVAYV